MMLCVLNHTNKGFFDGLGGGGGGGSCFQLIRAGETVWPASFY